MDCCSFGAATICHMASSYKIRQVLAAEIFVGTRELAKVGHIQLLTRPAHRHIQDPPFGSRVVLLFPQEGLLQVGDEDHVHLKPLEPVDWLDTYVEPSHPLPDGPDALRLAYQDRDLFIPVALLPQGKDLVLQEVQLLVHTAAFLDQGTRSVAHDRIGQVR